MHPSHHSLYIYILEWLQPEHNMPALLEENAQSIHAMKHLIMKHVMLANDFYSWEREKDGLAERRRNVIDVIMRLHNLSEEMAHHVLNGILIAEERKMKEILHDVRAAGGSEGLIQYLEGLMYIASGNVIWSTGAPRYNDPNFAIALHKVESDV
jgi:hypothetical protein